MNQTFNSGGIAQGFAALAQALAPNANAMIQADLARYQRDQLAAGTDRIRTLTPFEAAQLAAQAEQARAAAGLSAANAERIRTLTPAELANLMSSAEVNRANAENVRALIEPTVAETRSRARLNDANASLAGANAGRVMQGTDFMSDLVSTLTDAGFDPTDPVQRRVALALGVGAGQTPGTGVGIIAGADPTAYGGPEALSAALSATGTPIQNTPAGVGMRGQPANRNENLSALDLNRMAAPVTALIAEAAGVTPDRVPSTLVAQVLGLAQQIVRSEGVDLMTAVQDAVRLLNFGVERTGGFLGLGRTTNVISAPDAAALELINALSGGDARSATTPPPGAWAAPAAGPAAVAPAAASGGAAESAPRMMPDGRIIVVRNGQWVDAATGEPVQ